jgi:cyclopropane-fatty-acyl-phospholipid synthase
MSKESPPQASSVAVIGGGISGLSAAWLLLHGRISHVSGTRRYNVEVFEAAPRLGGHAWTMHGVDIGFQVFNLTTYPHLVGLFDTIGVETCESEMSFSCSLDEGKFEWASHGIISVLGGSKNLRRMDQLSKRAALLRDVLRFGKEAPQFVENKDHRITIGEYLHANKYSDVFITTYIRPMIAAVWSVPNATALEFPMSALVAFFSNHHLFNTVKERPQWRVVKSRSEEYVRKLCASLEHGGAVLNTSSPVQSVRRTSEGVLITLPDGRIQKFDFVVFATHADVTLKILGSTASVEEHRVLSKITYQPNQCVLHRDPTFMPKVRELWASWNSIEGSRSDATAGVMCTYWLNRLQGLDEVDPAQQLFVTLNPQRPPQNVVEEVTLHHPVVTLQSVEAQSLVPTIQGVDRIFYCGAWRYHGFHEDGIRSAVDVVELLAGKTPPWVARTPQPGMNWQHWAAFRLCDAFCRRSILIGELRITLPSGRDIVYGPPRDSPAPRAALRIHDNSFFWLMAKGNDIAVGEAYINGVFDTDNCTIGELFQVLSANLDRLNANLSHLGPFTWLSDAVHRRLHAKRNNNVVNAKKNIEAHYDLGNEMYSLFLDPTMSYSCAFFANHQDMSQDTLEAAQYAKLAMLLKKAAVQPGDRCLEIGCGWGALAVLAVTRFGADSWVALTLSNEQKDFVDKMVQRLNLSHKIQVLLQDYRTFTDAAGERNEVFDRVLSCEMLEAVGHEYLPSFYSAVNKVLKKENSHSAPTQQPPPRAVVQVITIPDERYADYCNTCDFIRKHIFPGGHLPSLQALAEAKISAGASDESLTLVQTEEFGLHYAETLRRWRDNFVAAKEQIIAVYGEAFYRKFLWYFGYCEGGFDAGKIHLHQLVYERGPEQHGGGSPVASFKDISSCLPNPTVATCCHRTRSRGVKTWLEGPWCTVMEGTVMHHRRGGAVTNTFCYPYKMSLVQLNDLQSSGSASEAKGGRWISYNRRNVLSFNPCDHGDGSCRTGEDLARWVQGLFTKRLSGEEKKYPAGRVELLTTLRSLGYSFNPISVFILFSAENEERIPLGLVLEVTNTPWDEREHYCIPLDFSSSSSSPTPSAGVHAFKKTLHVSPFMGMDKQYLLRFEYSPQSGRILVQLDHAASSPTSSALLPDGNFTARLEVHPSTAHNANSGSGISVPATASTITLKQLFVEGELCLACVPHLTQLWIHWHALKLAVRGAKIYNVEHHKTRILFGSETLAWLVILLKHLFVFTAAICLYVVHRILRFTPK